MVSMSNIWDRTTDVLSQRRATLTKIAALALFVPAVVRNGWAAYATPTSTGALAAGSVLSLLVAIVTLWGQLAVTAIASDPARTEREGWALAGRRFLPALGVYIVAMLVAIVLLVPVMIALSASGMDFAAMSQGVPPRVSPGALAFVSLYFVAFVVAALFVGARLMLLNPLIVNERLGLRAFARSWVLTRGLTWRLVGVILLFAIVWIIGASAVQFVTGTVLRLMLGADGIATATFVSTSLAAVVTAIYTVVVASFAAQLYVVRAGREAARTAA